MSISTDATVLTIGAAALAAAYLTGMLRYRGVVGADRLAGESAGHLALIALSGLSAWLIVSGLFAGAENSAGTAPTTAPALSPERRVVAGATSAAAGIAVMLLGHRVARDGGLRRIGMGLVQLPRGTAAGAVGAILAVPVTFASAVLTQWLWNALSIEHPGAHELLTIFGDEPSRALRALIILSAIVLAPMYEEMLFRGHVQTMLVAAFSKLTGRDGAAPRWLAILVTAGFFAVVHPAWMAPPIFVLAIALGYTYEKTANLWAPIVMHSLFNLVSVLLFLGRA